MSNGKPTMALATTERGAMIKSEFQKWAPTIKAIVPPHIRPDALTRIVMTAISQTPKLAECTPISLVRATVQAAMLGLIPNDGRGLAWIIPYKTEAQFQPGYRGLEALAYQSGMVRSVRGKAVHEGDAFEYSDGMVQVLRHVPSREPATDEKGTETRRLLAAYAVANVNGEPVAEVMYRPEIEAIMRRSQGFQAAEKYGRDSPWHLYFPRMAIKTTIKRLMKNMPVATERMERMERAIVLDDQAEAGMRQIFADEIEDKIPLDSNGKPATLAAAAQTDAAREPGAEG